MGIGLGALTEYAGAPEHDRLVEAIRTAHERGLGLVDVAPLYGSGASERLVAAAFGRSPDRPLVSTKVGRSLRPASLRNVVMRAAGEARARGRPAWTGVGAGALRAAARRLVGRRAIDALGPDGPGVVAVIDYDPDAIEMSINESRERLATDVLPIVFLHEPQGQPWSRLEAAWRRLIRLREAGIVQALGVATGEVQHTPAIIDRLAPDVVMIAGRYSLLDTSAAQRVLPTAHRLGIPVLVAGVFNSGLMADPRPGRTFDYRPAPVPVVRRAQAIASICARYQVPAASAALQFPFSHPAVRGVVVGVRDRHEVLADIAAFDRDVPAELWRDLQASGLVDAAPLTSAHSAA